jgi:hypothetical protein
LETKVAQRFFLFIVGLHLYYWSLYIECYRMFDCSISWYLWGCAILNDGLRSQYVLYTVCNRFWYEVRFLNQLEGDYLLSSTALLGCSWFDLNVDRTVLMD